MLCLVPEIMAQAIPDGMSQSRSGVEPKINPAFQGSLDVLKNGDRNSNGRIELSELVAHVQDGVPQVSARLNGRGHAAVAARGSTSDRQSARFGSRGEDFTLGPTLTVACFATTWCGIKMGQR